VPHSSSPFPTVKTDADPSTRKYAERLSKADPRSTRLTSSVSLSARTSRLFHSIDSRSHIAQHRPRFPIVFSSPTFQLLVRNRTRRRTRFSIPMSHVNKSSGAYLSFLCLLIVQRPTFTSIVAHYVTDIDSDRVRALIPVGFHLPYLSCFVSLHFISLTCLEYFRYSWRVFPLFPSSI
jgi:hypothetical protein